MDRMDRWVNVRFRTIIIRMRDPKALTDWLELDYYERPRRLRRWRGTALWIMLLLSCAGVAFALIPSNHRAFEAGPLSAPHAMFQHDCQACHVEEFATARRLVPGMAEHPAMNQACQVCHAGPPHHDKIAKEGTCASCHREHRGLEKLARVPDASCTSCHANLKSTLKDEEITAYLDVTGFAPGKHPEFARWRENGGSDPGTIRFNHKLHLAETGVADATGAKRQLDCQACHQPEAGGVYMKPVSYEQHCRQCHPLKVVVNGTFASENLKKAAADFAKKPAPHEQPALVRADLQGRYLEFVRDHPEAIQQSAAPVGRPIPGPPRESAVVKEQWSWVDDQLGKAERLIFQGGGGCQYCHRVESWKPDGLPVVALAKMPKPWFSHARFGHDAHRMLKCVECHPAQQSSQTADVLLPNVASCMQCHRQGAARSDCVLCHAYHNRAKDRDFKGTLTIQDCLRGDLPK